MFFYHSAKVIDYLCCQINLTLMGVFNQIVVLVFKQLNLCVFDFYQCAGSAFVVANKELNSIIVSRLQLTINLYTKPSASSWQYFFCVVGLISLYS